MSALFIGRFQPFHNGHLKAIKWILEKEKNISIVIGSSQEVLDKKNPFFLRERKKMLEKALLAENVKNFRIYHVPDCKDDVLWAKKVLRETKSKSLVFTRNPWTKKCFQKIGIKVKSHPMFFNELSATKIRNKVVKNQKWENLVPNSVFCLLKKVNGEKRIKSLLKNAY
jgi:nicotinamide-nucleotide adenylyltransferase